MVAGGALMRWLVTRGAAVLLGTILAVAVLVGAGLSVVYWTFGGSADGCTDSVKTQLADIADAVKSPRGSVSPPSAGPACLDSGGGAWTHRRFDVDGPRKVAPVLRALSSQLVTDGWLRRPVRSRDVDMLYVHDFSGTKYWAELESARLRVWIYLSAAAPYS